MLNAIPWERRGAFLAASWLLMRPSGTEPVVRFYAEALTGTDLEQLLKTGKSELIGDDG